MIPRAGVVLFAALIACGGDSQPALSVHGFVGTELATPVARPEATFTDSHGHPFRFDSATAGKVTLVYFGYTHCPDVCPVHLSNLAAVLQRIPDEVRRQVAVVFITIDPARDSLPVLNAWIKGFDPSFTGLTASSAVIEAAERLVHLGVAIPGSSDSDGNYTIGHAAPVIAYTRDGVGRVEYPFGTRQQDWAHDLPLLVAYGNP